MAPFKSSDGRNVGKPLKSYKTRNIGDNLATPTPSSLEATGGAIVEPGNGYKYHFLTANPHTFTIISTPGGVDVEYVLVGGGGGGGTYPSGNSGGGGGAGGYITGTFPNMVLGTYPVVIGQGGAALSNPGSPTTFNSIIAYGGGGGSPDYGVPGNPGASGGGGGGNGPQPGGIGNRIQQVINGVPDGTATIPAQLSPQGNPGGTGGPNSNTGKSGGGGGAGGVGGNAGTDSGAGGVGRAAFNGDTGIPTTYGTDGPAPGRWFAGGGAGGGYPVTGEDTGPGGAGGGGSSLTGESLNGINGTGGGGGGNQGASAGNGGHGIVILRYLYPGT